jgi:sigma-B regulation protein RsbU (phosphoserine phosphatase)
MTWFFYHFTEETHPPIIFYSLTIIYCLFFLAGWVIDNELTLSLSNPAIKNINIEGLLNITYYEVDPGLIFQIQFGSMFFVFSYFLYLLLKHHKTDERKLSKPIIIALVIYYFSTTIDILVASNILPFIYTSEYVFLVIILSMTYVLLHRFVNLHEEVEYLNINLEEKVKLRTSELNDTMLELRNTNNKLTATNKELNYAHQIAERDMNMATNVQSSLFPKEPPKGLDWDISFIFKPMSGVSGDFYDFYVKDNKLNGLILMDVSGHGVASGLITMIGRTIFHRTFYNLKKKKLNQIVDSANNNLISEIGELDNYITGIMLRFNDNFVEYVNAGHPDLYLKKSKNVISVDSEKENFKGFFLGFSRMKKKAEMIKFKMVKDDCLLLYTDCLFESGTPESKGDFYGEERIINSFKNVPEGSSNEILEHIMNDFYSHTQAKSLNDDLTVIVVKKK